jgi:hypothetical protein
MESPDGYREYIAGLKDGEEVSFEANLLPGNNSQLAVRTIFESGERRTWRLEQTQYSPSVVLEFRGVLTQFGFTFPLEDPTGISVTIKVTGKPDFVTVAP